MQFLKEKLYDPFLNLFRSGMDRKVLAMSLAVGFVSGIFPVPGTTSLVCIALSVLLQCNIAAAQLINLIVTPLDLFMFIPFIRLGDLALGQSLPENVGDIIVELRTSILGGIKMFWVALLHGVAAWAVVAPVLVFLLYTTIYEYIRTDKRRKTHHEA